MSLRLTLGGSRFAAAAFALLLAGCATDPAQPTPATSTTAPTVSTPIPTGPTQDPDPFVGVRLVLVASAQSVRAGEPVTFRIILENRNGTPLWTNPSFACSGTWDLGLYDEEGQRLRIDDRDAMGCPSGGPLETRVGSGSDAVAEYAWDGQARPALGQAQAPPRGRYEVRASAGYGDAPDDAQLDARTARVTLVIE